MTLQQKIEIICQEYDWKDIANDSKKVARRLAEIVEEDRQAAKTETAKSFEKKIADVINSKGHRLAYPPTRAWIYVEDVVNALPKENNGK